MPRSEDSPSTPAPEELAVTIDAVEASSGDDRVSTGEHGPAPGQLANLASRGARDLGRGELDYPELEQVPRSHYRFGAEIARGGMGRVVAARDLRLGREVAIKELLPKKRDAAARFEREARITARLQHPAIIHLYEAGTWPGGEPFYAMPRVVGRTLDVVVAERRALAERLALVPNVIAVVDALAYAHSQRVMHRDLKPANVLVGEFGETVVIDWGLAKDLARTPDASLAGPPPDEPAGDVVGTPGYMAPEQARGDHVDERADVYALGALLYTVLAGRAPYAGPHARRVLDQVLAGPPPALRAIEPGVPADLVAIVAKAMARERTDRYPTAAELATDLKRFQTGQLVLAHHYSAGERLRRWLRRHRAVVSIAAAALVALGLIGALSVRRILAEKHRTELRRAALLEEQGRSQLLGGRAGRALVYLQAAIDRGRSGGAIRFLVADAMRPFDTLIARLPAGGEVHAVAYSPDGAHVVTGGDGGAILWDVASHTALAHLGPEVVRAVRFDPLGARVATAGDDGVVRVWSAPDGALRWQATGHRGRVDDLAWSSIGTTLISAGEDGTARTWDAATGAPTATLAGHQGAVRSVRIGPDGYRVVTASDDGTAAVWAVGDSDPWPLRGQGGRVTSARFSPDGRWVLTAGDDRRAIIWDPTTGKQVLTLAHRAPVTSAEWSADGARVVTASADHTARLWRIPAVDPDAPAELVPDATLVGHSDIVLRAAFDAAGQRVITVGRDRTVRLWAAADGVPLASFEGHADLIEAAELSPDGTSLVTGSRDGTAQLWDARAGERAPIDAGEEIRGLALSPDGALVVTGTTNGEALAWPLTGEPLATARHPAPITALAFSPDGARLASGGEDGTALVSSVAGPEADALRLAHGRPVLAVRFAPDGARLATGCADGVVRIWDARDGRLVHELRGHRGAALAIAWSGDGRRVASGSADGTARVWDAGRGAALGPPVIVGHAALAVALTADGAWAVAGGDGATPQVWRTDGGGGARSLEGPTSVVTVVAFTADGARIVTGGVDATLRIWDARSGRLLGQRQGHHGPILAGGLALAADDVTAVTAGDDHTVRFWDLRAPPVAAASLRAFVAARVPWCLDADDQPRRVDPAAPSTSCDARRD